MHRDRRADAPSQYRAPDHSGLQAIRRASAASSRGRGAAFLGVVELVGCCCASVAAGPQDGTRGCVVDVEPAERAQRQVVGRFYWHPVEAADGVIDLTMIAVRPDCSLAVEGGH